jgi:hypothetical protein
MNEPLIRFYTADGEDHAGRTHSDILAFDDRETQLGWVVIRFYGTSNGYYSESVSFVRLDENGN